MFSMLVGPWPRLLADGTRLEALEADVAAGRASAGALAAAVETAVTEAVAAQVEAGMDLVTDGWVRWADPVAAVLGALREGDTGRDGLLVRGWRSAASRADVPVAAMVPGPWTLALAAAAAAPLPAAATPLPATAAAGDPTGRAGALADALAGELEALAAAGCPVVVVAEPGAVTVGPDEARRAAFRAAHDRLLTGADGLHAMLAITGGNADAAGPATILGAPYASFLFDLVAGPENWRLVRAAGPTRGIVVAALEAGNGAERRDQAPELAWAAQYAASANGRGLERVGLANGTPLGALTLAEARDALRGLARAASLAALPAADAVRAGLDPRSLVHRGAAPARGAGRVPGS